ncbi:hypothetical protein BN7_1908 [Wickerhamomyces ciferrii]|uniref:Uncharacterized protein n=1 Tax=Wickerhamomyces ciferrii (strain ATCC 14091 / BCRC 22168 / CBS 111 / JCM 3599 / NBRC 0793 / NRRL Y-1031 F-60-10) TaxID=1206466 RepID=K0KMM4_WICCF|nr:uncharacterized protein BN7_1908 [Wickerhamomyces ciferrii]CCH42363.1 hypothetical protein BN7_1908 [Wickerhamomyces ciferrii]
MAKHRVKPYSTPGTTWRLKVLHIRHSNLSQLESQYPNELIIASPINQSMIKQSIQKSFNSNTSKSNNKQSSTISGRPFSVFSSNLLNDSKNSLSRNSTSDHSSISSSTLTNPISNPNSISNTLTNRSSSNKLQLKYRNTINNPNDDEILPSV